MDTTTVLVVIGCGVLVKTLAFIGFVVRRDRRQREQLAAVQGAAEETDEPWRLQWADPGVLLVENTRGEEAARDVRLTATLTTACGTASTITRHETFVGTGACFDAPFPDLVPRLAEAAGALMSGGAGASPAELQCGLSGVLEWRGPDGQRRRQVLALDRVVPVPDLAAQTA